MASITLTNIDKRYPSGFHAVKDLNLGIEDGQFLVLLGPSGCGKSTTLRMIAGLEDVTAGEIAIAGRRVNDVHPKDRDIAMVFQNYALYPHMTVRQNMAFALKMRNTPKPEIEKRVGSVATMLGLGELLDRKPAALSGGQRQRVAVGRAIVREPKAFLFDEPLSNLDAKLRTTTRAELKALHQRLKTTTVYVTHDQEEAMTLGDRIVIMAGGVLQQDGPPLEVYRHPVNRFVAGFIGTPPMNFLEGTVSTDGGTLAFIERGTNGARIPLPTAWRDATAARAGQPIIFGVRPQALSAAPVAGTPGLQVHIALVEPLGDQMDISGATAAGTPIVARVPASEVRAGTTCTLGIDVSRTHLFEPGEFGKRLTP